MATLLDAEDEATTGTGASHTGPCTLHVHEDSVLDGALVQIQMADSDTEAEYKTIREFNGKETATIEGQGTYFLRAILSRVGTSTSVSITTTQ